MERATLALMARKGLWPTPTASNASYSGAGYGPTLEQTAKTPPASGDAHPKIDAPQGNLKCGMGRDVDGISPRLYQHQWPSRPDEPQTEYEPPRTLTKSTPCRNKRLAALGNAIVPQQIYPIFQGIIEIEHTDGVKLQ